jgi:hypothetical protein
MPKHSPSSARTRDARALAAAQGIPYTAALRQVTLAREADPAQARITAGLSSPAVSHLDRAPACSHSGPR